MTWGNDLVQWWASDEGWRVLTGAVIPALSILLAGLIAALIARSSTKRLLKHHDRDALTSAVGAFVLAGRTAAQWHDHSELEQSRVDQLISEAETRLRLLPIPGAALAANWATHQLESMKRHSSGFRFQAQQTLGDYREALITWSQKPRTAKKLFGTDLERWRYEGDEPEYAESENRGSAPEAAAVAESGAESGAEPSADSLEPPATTGPVRDPALAAALAAAPPPTASTAVSPTVASPTVASATVASPTVVDDSADAPAPMSASTVRERITSNDQV